MTYYYCYDDGSKAAYAQKTKTALRKVIKALGLQKGQYDLRFNPGGIAVWGEITLHTDRFYVQVTKGIDLGILVRSCKGQKDYTGGPNQWWPVDLLKTPEVFAEKLRTAFLA